MQFFDVYFVNNINIYISIRCYYDFIVGFDEAIYGSNAVKTSTFYTNIFYSRKLFCFL